MHIFRDPKAKLIAYFGLAGIALAAHLAAHPYDDRSNGFMNSTVLSHKLDGLQCFAAV
jgi:hypothetical protein